MIVDPKGKIAYINKAYCDYINIDRTAVLGRPVLDYIDTSLMVDVAKALFFEPEVGVLHQVSAQQYRDGEHYCIVNRTNISETAHQLQGPDKSSLFGVP